VENGSKNFSLSIRGISNDNHEKDENTGVMVDRDERDERESIKGERNSESESIHKKKNCELSAEEMYVLRVSKDPGGG